MKKGTRKCESCEKFFLKDQISHGPNPYYSEINGDETPMWLCDNCYEEFLGDI